MEAIVVLFEFFSSLLSMAWSILPVVGMWLVFEKAGEAGWKAVVPFYNMYTMLKIGDRKKYWKQYLIGIILTLVPIALLMLYVVWGLLAFMFALAMIDFGLDALAALTPVILISIPVAIAGSILSLIASIHGYSGICKKMGQESTMVVGLVLLGPIFWMMLGVDNQYQWEQPIACSESTYEETWQDESLLNNE